MGDTQKDSKSTPKKLDLMQRRHVFLWKHGTSWDTKCFPTSWISARSLGPGTGFSLSFCWRYTHGISGCWICCARFPHIESFKTCPSRSSSHGSSTSNVGPRGSYFRMLQSGWIQKQAEECWSFGKPPGPGRSRVVCFFASYDLPMFPTASSFWATCFRQRDTPPVHIITATVQQRSPSWFPATFPAIRFPERPSCGERDSCEGLRNTGHLVVNSDINNSTNLLELVIAWAQHNVATVWPPGSQCPVYSRVKQMGSDRILVLQWNKYTQSVTIM